MAGNIRKLPLVWNKHIDPAVDKDFQKRITKPVILEDLGGTYITAGLRIFERKGDRIDLDKLRQDLDQWHNPNLKTGESGKNLMTHNFGCVLWLNCDFLRAKNWKEAIEEIKKRKFYLFDCWGTGPGCNDWENGGISLAVSDDIQEYLITTLGKYFISWDNGENDGRWFWQVMRNCPSLVTREESYQYFMGWFKTFFANLKNYVSSLCGLTFPHYFAQIDGSRMIGAEFIQGLPSIPMWAAWVRGAARQYQMLWFAAISIWNFFGYKSFEEDKFKDLNTFSNLDLGKGNPSAQGGPDRGSSMSLLKRTWYLLFMYGVNIEALETSQFYRPAGPVQPSVSSAGKNKEGDIAPEAKKQFLSPIGKMQIKATSFCAENEKRRGVQYCPVGILLDFYCGWVPPRHLYSDSFYTVWGGIPYQQGDHQIDLFFREMYPRYQDCPYYRNERGFLTPTPYGDIVDVLLSDVRPEILSRYHVVPVLGEISVKGELLKKLSEFAKNGGVVIWSLAQLNEDALRLSGIKRVGKKMKANDSYNTKTKKSYCEKPFIFSQVITSGVKVLLKTAQRNPLVISKSVGKGKIITVIVPFGLTNRMVESHPIIGADPDKDTTTLSFLDKALGSPYSLLEGVKETVFGILNDCNLIEVTTSSEPLQGSIDPEQTVPVQYLTNVTDKSDNLVVTIINNEPIVVYLHLKVKRAKIIRALDLMRQEQQLPIINNTIALTLFPGDNSDFNIYIIELHLDRHVVRFVKGKT